MPARDRLPHAQRQILAVLQTRPEISYNDLAAECFLDRSHVVASVRALETRRRITRVPGRGRRNRYAIVED